MAQQRRQTTQSVAWFWDMYKRELLALDPPYQRRSVWSQSYKDYFVDTILLAYPAPAVFLFEDIHDDGITEYSVVDGKQRLATVFEFLEGKFPVSETASIERFRGVYFSDLPSDVKKQIYSYQFSIEFLPSTDEGTLNNIFDRINKNVAKLTPQELRHARFSGYFITVTEDLAEVLEKELPKDFPRITHSSRRQMKDVEFVAQLLLLIERGVESYSQGGLDRAYSDRDEDWEERTEVEREFRSTIEVLASWSEAILAGDAKRLRNQADFYSLFGAVVELLRKDALPKREEAIPRLEEFMARVGANDLRPSETVASRFYDATRSASNDLTQRKDRIEILRNVILGGTGARA